MRMIRVTSSPRLPAIGKIEKNYAAAGGDVL